LSRLTVRARTPAPRLPLAFEQTGILFLRLSVSRIREFAMALPGGKRFCQWPEDEPHIRVPGQQEPRPHGGRGLHHWRSIRRRSRRRARQSHSCSQRRRWNRYRSRSERQRRYLSQSWPRRRSRSSGSPNQSWSWRRRLPSCAVHVLRQQSDAGKTDDTEHQEGCEPWTLRCWPHPKRISR
jgi:hypothetical protein